MRVSNMMKLLLLAVILCTVPCTQCQRCDPEPQMDLKSLTAEGVRSMECLQTIKDKQNYSGKKLVTFLGMDFPQGLPVGAFEGFEFEIYHFQGFNMARFSSSTRSPFEGVNAKIRKMVFLKPVHHIREWDWTHLAKLQLETIAFSEFPNFSFNSTNTLPKSFSKLGGESVRELEIVNSCLQNIETGSLATFVNLEKLSLAGNNLRTIYQSVFPSAPHLKIIDLSGNLLQCLDPVHYWTPTQFPALEEIRLSGNALKAVFKDFHTGKVRNIFINSNRQLNCDRKLAWLLKLNQGFWEKKNEPPALCLTPRGLNNQPLAKLTFDRLYEESSCVECAGVMYQPDGTVGPCVGEVYI